MNMKRSLTYSGWKGSIYLDDDFWDAFKEIAKIKGMRHAALAEEINSNKGRASLSSAIRVYVLDHFMRRARSGEGVLREMQDHAAKLRATIEVLMERDRRRGEIEGHASVEALIAGRYANA